MNYYIYFTYAGLGILLLLMIIYFIKPRIKNIDNRLYSLLLAVTFIGCIFEISMLATSKVMYEYPLINLISSKGFLIICEIWIFILTLYTLIISYNNEKEFKYKFKMYILLIITIISILFTIISPIYYHFDNGLTSYSYTYGPSVDVVRIIAIILITVNIFIIIRRKKFLNLKKLLPVITYIILTIIDSLLQQMEPRFVVLSYIEVVIVVLMYFTIENPDIKMIEQLNIAKQQADKANKAKTDFLSSMSHEIRTPLNAIVGFSELIKTSETLDEAKENANDIVGASQTLLEIVNGILDISKIEAGKIEIHNSAYNALELFDGIVKLGKGRLGEKPLDYRIHIAEDIPETLYGDHANLKKIVINLLTNAIKYTDHGYVDFSVKCVNTDDICRLIISVEDSGRGIKEEDINKLFTKFQRLDEDRNTTIEGTGLGLAITKQLIDLMGGKIVVHSTYGEGSKFTVAIDQKISNEKVVSDKVETVDNLDLTGKKILIVDDNKLNLKVASKILETYKPTIETLESGIECLDKINSGNKYDLILMDDMMPRMNGTETMLRLRKIENFNTPVVILTANALSGQEQKYLNDGFDGYLSKPIDKEKLHEVLSKFLVNNENTIVSKKVNLSEIEEEINLTGKNILIVDDNKLNIKVESKILSEYQPNIDDALSGVECINKIKNTTYDLIFMDDMMPEKSGVETFKELKSLENFNTPVVILTANAIEGMKEQYLSLGFVDYLSKPLDKEELKRVLKEVFKEEKKEAYKEKIETPKQFSSVYITNDKYNKDYLINNKVDIDYALSLLGDLDTYNDTLKEFYNNINNRIDKLKEYELSNNLKDYSIEVHALKSDSKYLGFSHLADMALKHELESKKNNLEYIHNNFDNLLSEIDNIIGITKVYLDKN